jgi:hypothetical protein
MAPGDRDMNTLPGLQLAHLNDLQTALWLLYLLAALMLPAYHLRPLLRYLRGSAGIGDADIRTEALQCVWRVPALLFSVFVVPSLPLFLSIFLDLLGRVGRVLAMRGSHRRWLALQSAEAASVSASSPGLRGTGGSPPLSAPRHETCPATHLPTQAPLREAAVLRLPP